MRKSKHTWKGLFYDYHNRAYWDPDIQLRASEVRRTIPEDTGHSTEDNRIWENQFICYMKLKEIADPGLFWSWNVGPQWHSLQFRTGLGIWYHDYIDSQYPALAFYTYEINHSYVQLMIRHFGSPELQYQVAAWWPTTLRVDRDDDVEFITENACTWCRQYIPLMCGNITYRLI